MVETQPVIMVQIADRAWTQAALQRACASALHLFQYMTLTGGIADAADQVAVSIVLATLPASLIPWWRSFLLGILRQRLARRGRWLISAPCQVFTTAPAPLAQLHAQPG